MDNSEETEKRIPIWVYAIVGGCVAVIILAFCFLSYLRMRSNNNKKDGIKQKKEEKDAEKNSPPLRRKESKSNPANPPSANGLKSDLSHSVSEKKDDSASVEPIVIAKKPAKVESSPVAPPPDTLKAFKSYVLPTDELAQTPVFGPPVGGYPRSAYTIDMPPTPPPSMESAASMSLASLISTPCRVEMYRSPLSSVSGESLKTAVPSVNATTPTVSAEVTAGQAVAASVVGGEHSSTTSKKNSSTAKSNSTPMSSIPNTPTLDLSTTTTPSETRSASTPSSQPGSVPQSPDVAPISTAGSIFGVPVMVKMPTRKSRGSESPPRRANSCTPTPTSTPDPMTDEERGASSSSSTVSPAVTTVGGGKVVVAKAKPPPPVAIGGFEQSPKPDNSITAPPPVPPKKSE